MVTSEQIVTTRKRLRKSQGELAADFGVNLTTVWRWENEGVPEQGVASKALEKWVSDNSEPGVA